MASTRVGMSMCASQPKPVEGRTWTSKLLCIQMLITHKNMANRKLGVEAPSTEMSRIRVEEVLRLASAAESPSGSPSKKATPKAKNSRPALACRVLATSVKDWWVSSFQR